MPDQEEQTEKKVKKTNWKITDKRFVAFFDILGFKDKIMRMSHDDIYKELEYISKTIGKLIQEHYNDDSMNTGTYAVNFSDSIAIFSKSDTVDDFNYFVVAIALLMQRMVKEKIMVKAGVAYGEISVNKDNRIFFGQPIIDAYSMEEDVNYLGITCHATFDNYYESRITLENNIEGDNLIRKFKTPLKSGKIMHTNIYWFNPALKLNQALNPKESIENMYSTVSGSPRRYLDNTLEVIDSLYPKTSTTSQKNP